MDTLNTELPTAVVEKLGIEVGAGKVIGKKKFAGKVVGYI